jgi:hypothetical protein
VKVHCYVLTENHFHLVATTPEGNLSKWIHQLKTAYTVYLNRRHRVVGHLFEGRFKSTVIEAEKNDVIDHVIVGQSFDDRPGYFSFKEAGVI